MSYAFWRSPPHSLMMNPPIHSTKTTRQNALRKSLDFASLPADRIELGVRGRSGAGVADFREVTWVRPFSFSIAVAFAVSIALLTEFVCKLKPGVAG